MLPIHYLININITKQYSTLLYYVLTLKVPVTTAADDLFRFFLKHFYTPPHDSGGVLWFHVGRPCVYRPPVHQSYVRPFVCISFPDDNLILFNRMCIDIVEICFGIANGQILTELSARDTPIFSFSER